MVCNFCTQDVASVLRVTGELDALSVADLKPTIDRIVDKHPLRLSVDLSGLRLIDARGVSAIVSLFKAVQSYEGKMTVLGACGQPLAVLRVLRLDNVLLERPAQGPGPIHPAVGDTPPACQENPR
jgi:anti-anti-sigma factor